jgi:CRISPR/Cas system-associated exonuclease Cas4 (RecB family)
MQPDRTEGALAAELDAAAHDTLVQTYIWANKQFYVQTDAELRAKAEAWAKEIEDAGKTAEVLSALSSGPCPECGR